MKAAPKGSVVPFLMFQGEAKAAIDLYVATLPRSRVVSLELYGEGGQGTRGQVAMAILDLGGLEVMCFDSPVKHAFTFTPATSLFVTCACEDEIDRLAATMSDGGHALMPLGDYGFSRKFAWVADRFGVSWQFNLP